MAKTCLHLCLHRTLRRAGDGQRAAKRQRNKIADTALRLLKGQ